jgi:hypothetical protein
MTAGLKFRQLPVPSFGGAQPSSQVDETLLETVEPLYTCEQSDIRPRHVTIAATPIPFGIGRYWSSHPTLQCSILRYSSENSIIIQHKRLNRR